MPDSFTIEKFMPHVGEVFHVIVSETHELKVLLTEIAALASDDSPLRKRQPFALVFHAPGVAYVPQLTYRVEKPGLEPFDCFLVPIGPDENGMRFEAIFT